MTPRRALPTLMGAPAHPAPPAAPAATVGTSAHLLPAGDRRRVAAFALRHSGGPPGAPFLPAAVRDLPLPLALALATDDQHAAAWRELERRKVTRDVRYFVSRYGHLQGNTGPPFPFDPWPEQLDALHVIDRERLVVWLKARQLGATWTTLHYGYHLIAFHPETPRARVLALSQTQEDANNLNRRTRRIHELLPAFLRQPEEQDTRGSTKRFAIAGRGSIASLPSTAGAARSETATLLIADEAAHVRAKGFAATWTAAQDTLGETGRAVIISTGNGDQDQPGDGQAFAQIVRGAQAGTNGFRLLFHPSSTDPRRRTPEWRARRRRSALSEEAFLSEQPETVDQALVGRPVGKVFPPAHVDAVERLGRTLDELREDGDLAAPADGHRLLATDFGEGTTHGLVIWPLEAGGLYVTAEVEGQGWEASAFADALHAEAAATAGPRPDDAPLGLWAYDAAGAQVARTAKARAQRAHADRWAPRATGRRVRTRPVPFGKRKRDDLDYLKWLARRTWLDEEVAVLAVSPRCAVLLRQLRGLRTDDDGVVVKEDDHGPDALIAGADRAARRFRPRSQGDDVEDEPDEE